MESWREISSFPGYFVSDLGRVRNEQTKRSLTLLRNQGGIVYVGMSKDLVQYKRSVSTLVAEAFLPQHSSPAFDTPINLDGDRTNNSISNLIWRPRWFAVKYFQQFNSQPQGLDIPIIELETEEVFKTSWEAAVRYGLLDVQIAISIHNKTYVWPTYQFYRLYK